MAGTMPNLFGVAGKNVLVTGGSRGIGLMIAQGFASSGANVLLTSRDEKACKEAAAVVGKDCLYVTSNVSTRDGCKALATHTSQVFNGKLDVLVNNAGASWGEPLERESGKMNWGWDKVLDLNVKGMFYLIRECTPMLERERVEIDDGRGLVTQTADDPGRIINIGSVAGLIPQEAPTHAYDVSKAAVHHLTKKLAADLAPKGITVNAIAPGYVPSRMSAGLKSWGADASKISSSIPLGRMGDQSDMSGACLYLSSRAGAWVTGVILPVDGGTVGAMSVPLSSL